MWKILKSSANSTKVQPNLEHRKIKAQGKA